MHSNTRWGLGGKALRIPSNAMKQVVWDALWQGRPVRTPLRWNANVRTWLLDPAQNREGWTFEGYLHDPQVTLGAQARFQSYAARYFSQSSDRADTLPEQWSGSADVLNCYDAAFYGGRIHALPEQIPAVEPFLSLGDVDTFLATDYCVDLAGNPFLRERLAYTEALRNAARDFRFDDRGAKVQDFILGFDGPVTAGAAIFGADFFLLLGLDPEKGERVIEKITRETVIRNRWLRRRAGQSERVAVGGFADDSVQLISAAMYRERVLKWHVFWCDQTDEAAGKPLARGCHLCGDATRHFKTIRDAVGVGSFDTGFPVDFGWLRRELGPEVMISGGPHVGLLRHGMPEACYREAERILAGGVREGGKFILQEGNNLPPLCPTENLQAVYQACLEHGSFS